MTKIKLISYMPVRLYNFPGRGGAGKPTSIEVEISKTAGTFGAVEAAEVAARIEKLLAG